MNVSNLSVKCDSCGEINEPQPPINRFKYGIALAVVAGLLGIGIGLTIGIATAGFGMAATPFTLIIGAYSGWKIGAWGAEKQDGYSCPDCNHIYGSGSLLS